MGRPSSVRKRGAKRAAPPPDVRRDEDTRREVRELFANITKELPALDRLLAQANEHWTYEDGVYRFYHQSLKVFGQLQPCTTAIVEKLSSLLPGRPLNSWFARIVADGTGRTFEWKDNERWLEATRPIVEAFFHARFFLEMICRYGHALEYPPTLLPSGWAAVLYLYDLR